MPKYGCKGKYSDERFICKEESCSSKMEDGKCGRLTKEWEEWEEKKNRSVK